MPLDLSGTPTETVRHVCRGGKRGAALLRPGARWASLPLCAGAQPGGSTHPHVQCTHTGKGGGTPASKRHKAGMQPALRAHESERRRECLMEPPPPPASGRAEECSMWPATGARARRPPNRPPPYIDPMICTACERHRRSALITG